MNGVRVGVIGVGRMGGRHCRVYSNLRHVELRGVCDAVAQQGASVARQFEVESYDSVEALLEHVDAVTLAVPTPLHLPLAERCLARGAHVLVEKPIAATVQEGEALARLADVSGRVVLVGHIERFSTAFIELKNVIDGMVPLALNFRRLSPSEGSNVDVDVVLDLMIHDLNLALDLVGRQPSWVTAHGLSVFSGSIDHAVAHLGFGPDLLVTLTASRITEHKVRAIEVTTREAFLECDLLSKSILVHRQTVGEYLHPGAKYRQESVVERIQVPTFEPLFLQLQHFVDCIRDGRQPIVSARDGLDALRLAERIRDLVLSGLGRPCPLAS